MGGGRAWHTSLECSSETTIVHPAKASFGIPMVTLKEKGSILLILAFGGSLFTGRQNLSKTIWQGRVQLTVEHSSVNLSLVYIMTVLVFTSNCFVWLPAELLKVLSFGCPEFLSMFSEYGNTQRLDPDTT